MLLELFNAIFSEIDAEKNSITFEDWTTKIYRGASYDPVGVIIPQKSLYRVYSDDQCHY